MQLTNQLCCNWISIQKTCYLSRDPPYCLVKRTCISGCFPKGRKWHHWGSQPAPLEERRISELIFLIWQNWLQQQYAHFKFHPQITDPIACKAYLCRVYRVSIVTWFRYRVFLPSNIKTALGISGIRSFVGEMTWRLGGRF